MHYQKTLTVRTKGRGLYEITRDIEAIISQSGIHTGLCVVFCRHTSASLMIQENADPSVQRDILAWLARIAPDGDPRYEHHYEGPDDMPAHLRTMITRTNETIPIVNGNLAIGTWQGIYLAEHRTSPHTRSIVIHISGEQE